MEETDGYEYAVQSQPRRYALSGPTATPAPARTVIGRLPALAMATPRRFYSPLVPKPHVPQIPRPVGSYPMQLVDLLRRHRRRRETP